MELKDVDTNEFIFDPKKNDFVEKLEQYIEFKLPENLKNPRTGKSLKYDKWKLFAYIAFVHDLHSSLMIDIPFYPHRKYNAALLVGWEKNPKTERFNDDIEAIILGEIVEINNCIVKFCLLQNNTELVALTSYSSMYAVENVRALSGNFDDKTFALIQKLKDAISESEEKIFGGKEVRSMVEALYSAVEKERLRIRPEDIAQRIAEGKEPIDSEPYGKYKPEQSKFLGDA